MDALEEELADVTSRRSAVALASGTAALHLALLSLQVGQGDRVITSTLTFAATANAITYVGAEPVFVDVNPSTWQLDADILEQALQDGPRPAAIIPVDLYGQCCSYDRILALADAHGVPVIEDAAEALGSTFRGEPAGSFGQVGVLSFNSNKIITGGGGGALLTSDSEVAERVRYLASQARQPVPHYEHTEVGFNYRLSNLNAAIVRGQLCHLDEKVERRRAINALYRNLLSDLPGLTFMPGDPAGRSNAWLTCITVAPQEGGTNREAIRVHLLSKGIESRPVWKPMHLQPVFADRELWGREVAESLFNQGLCLPSGSALADVEIEEVAAEVRSMFE